MKKIDFLTQSDDHRELEVLVDLKRGPVLLSRSSIPPGLELRPATLADRDALVAHLQGIDYSESMWSVTIVINLNDAERFTIHARRSADKQAIAKWTAEEINRQVKSLKKDGLAIRDVSHSINKI